MITDRFVQAKDLRVGMVTSAGRIVKIRKSASGRTIFVTGDTWGTEDRYTPGTGVFVAS